MAKSGTAKHAFRVVTQQLARNCNDGGIEWYPAWNGGRSLDGAWRMVRASSVGHRCRGQIEKVGGRFSSPSNSLRVALNAQPPHLIELIALVRAFRPPDTTSDGGALVEMNPREKGLDIDLVPPTWDPCICQETQVTTQHAKEQNATGLWLPCRQRVCVWFLDHWCGCSEYFQIGTNWFLVFARDFGNSSHT